MANYWSDSFPESLFQFAIKTPANITTPPITVSASGQASVLMESMRIVVAGTAKANVVIRPTRPRLRSPFQRTNMATPLKRTM